MNAQPPTPHRIGVCSWSLVPSDAAELAERVRRLGLDAVQLALDPIRTGAQGWGEIETINALRARSIAVLSGMMGMEGEDYSTLETIARTGGVRPDETWGRNLRAADETARLARRMGIGLVTFHAGFIPHQRGRERDTMLDRLRTIIDRFDDQGVRIAFETGQESADTLLEALEGLSRPHAGVNFDPANMILYGMGNPVAALRRLAPRVVQLHIKDAVAPIARGQWGTEVAVGSGQVEWHELFTACRDSGLGADLVIERESGDARRGGEREHDIAAARDLLLAHGFAPGGGRGSGRGGGAWGAAE